MFGESDQIHIHQPVFRPRAPSHGPLFQFNVKQLAMILVAIVAELMEDYTVLVARVLEQLLNGAAFPRRMRFLILRSLPFAAAAPGRHARLNRAPSPRPRRGGMRG
jgi:hypothetical protein